MKTYKSVWHCLYPEEEADKKLLQVETLRLAEKAFERFKGKYSYALEMLWEEEDKDGY